MSIASYYTKIFTYVASGGRLLQRVSRVLCYLQKNSNSCPDIIGGKLFSGPHANLL